MVATFEGNGNTISGVYVNRNGNFAGIFGNISKCYYINTITIPSIGELESGGTFTLEEARANVTAVSDDLTYEEFKTWIETK